MIKTINILIIALIAISYFALSKPDADMKKIKGGTFVPLYGTDSARVRVQDFLIDVYPVTNEQYLNFIQDNPKWKRSKAIKLFVDKNYLRKWKGDLTLGKEINPNAPVTNVSWFAAKEYCECQGKRLPTMDEWEYVAMASEKKANAQADSAFNHRIVRSYESPKTYAQDVGSTYYNYWGVADMHGLVWEWTSDFNSVLISGESRQDVDKERSLFCAGGSVNATNLMDYAAFMRYAFRGSVEARFCVQNLGFRCAKNIKE